MGHGYVKSHYGDNCFYKDSSWKRYQRAHGDTTIFIFGNSCYNSCYPAPRYCFGGSPRNAFLGGMGIGVGYALSQWTSRMMGGLWNLFGGGGAYSCYNQGGYYNSYNPSNMYNSWNNSPWSNQAVTPRTPAADSTDADCQKIADFQEEIKNLTGTLTEEKYNDLKTRIETAKTESEKDEKNTVANLKSYNELLAALEKHKPAAAEKEESVNENNKANENDDNTVKTQTQESTVKINGNDVNIEGITNITSLNGLSITDVSNISKENAIKMLEKAGLKNTDGTYKLSIDRGILALLAKAEVNVKCATNNDSVDQFVIGQVSDVSETGDFSFNIDCSTNSSSTRKYKYSFKQQLDGSNGEKIFRLTEIDKNASNVDGYIASNWNTRDYIWNDDNSYLEITGDPQVSSNSNGRKKLDNTATNIQFSE